MISRIIVPFLVFLVSIFMLGYTIALQTKTPRHGQAIEECVDKRVLIKFGDGRKALEIHPTTREFIKCK